MICPGCKKDSRASDFCSFCMRPFTPADIAAAASAPPPLQSLAPPINIYAPPASPPPSPGLGSYAPTVKQPAARPLSAPLSGRQSSATPMPNYLQQTASMPAQTAPVAQPRVSLTGEVFDDNVSQPVNIYAPPAAPVVQTTASFAPPPLTATQPVPPPPIPRSIHGARVAAAQLGPSAVSAQFIERELEKSDISLGERWEKSLAIIFPLIALSMVLVHFVPDAYVYAALFDFFIVGLAMGATRAIESFDEAFMDCTAILAVSYICGPIAGIGAYVLVGLIKQEWNSAALFVLFGHIVVRAIFVIAYPDNIPWFSILPYFQMISVTGLISFCGTALSFGGWMMSNFFRPMNE